MLSATNISKHYGAVTALNDVCFSVLPGEIVALAGENGSGKSTLARILSGSAVPDSGCISIDGKAVTFENPRAALDYGVSIVTQELTTIPHLSVAENVTLPRLRGRAGRMFRRRKSCEVAVQILERLGLHLDPMQPAGKLTTVQQAILEIAKAVATSPRFLILDEATSRLGPGDVRLVLGIVNELAVHGVGTVLITHRIAEMTAVCSRVTVLRDGNYAGELTHDEIKERPLVRLMVGRDISGQLQRSTGPGAPVLQIKNVRVKGSKCATSMSVARHEVVGLAGLVGAGRTELLEALAGLRERAEGEVRIGDVKIPPNRPRAAIDAGISMVPEDRHRDGLVLAFSVTENSVLGQKRGYSWVRRSRDREETFEMIRKFGIKVADTDSPITSLSGGNQQKVVLARALAKKPLVLLLDEPTRGVDVGAREEIYELIGRLADEGLAVLLASSDLVELINVCDRIVVMHESEIVGEIAGSSATEEEIALLSAGGSPSDYVA